MQTVLRDGDVRSVSSDWKASTVHSGVGEIAILYRATSRDDLLGDRVE